MEVRNYLHPAEREGPKRDALSDEELKLKRAIDNDWSYAWNDFNNQLFVVTVSTIFLGVETFAIFYRLYNSSISKGINFFDFFSEHWGMLIGLSIAFLLLVRLIWLSIMIFFKGISAEPNIIESYIPNPDDKSRRTRKPPSDSPLTKMRYFTIIYAIFLMIWSISFLPSIHIAIRGFTS